MNCSNCKNPVDTTSFVCEWCGHVISQNVQQVGQSTTVDNYLQIINNNMDALHAIPRPSIKDVLITIAWWYLAIATIGIVTFFWKRPKSKFDQDSYNKLSSTIEKNIRMFEQGARSNQNLISQIDILKDDFNKLNTQFKEQIKYRNIAIAVTIGLIALLLIFSDPNKSKNLDSPIKSDSTSTIK